MKGIDDELKQKLHNFYKDFITDFSYRENFIEEKLKCKKSNTPRRMINSVERLVTLSNDIEKIRKRESLKIFFLVVCIETLYSLRCEHLKTKMKKIDMVIDFFTNFIALDDQDKICKDVEISICGMNPQIVATDMEVFALIINEIRNIFAHEGNYWSFSFAYDDVPIINVVTSSICKGSEKSELSVSTSLYFEDFKRICVNGYINFIDTFFTKIKEI